MTQPQTSLQAGLASTETKRTLRFLATGALNTVFGFGLYALLLWVGFIPHAAQLLGRIGGVIFNYFSYGRFAFGDLSLNKRRFLTNYLGNYLFAVALLWILLQFTSNGYLAGAATMVVTTFLNFLVMRFYVAQNEEKPSGELRSYRPHSRDWRWMPEWALLAKDTVHDISHGIVDRMMVFRPVRAIWRFTIGRKLKREILSAGCLLVHIPKTGGTSISRRLYGRNLPHHRAISWQRRFEFDYDDWCRFAVLREPVSRFLSAWRFTKAGGSSMILNSRFEMAQLAPMEPLEGLLERFENDPDLLRAVPAFRPQVEFVTDIEGKMMVDRLFVMDSDEHSSERLAEWLSVEPIPHLNKSAPTSDPLDPGLEDRIRALYADDLALYQSVVAQGGMIKFSSREPIKRAEYPPSMPLRV